MTKGTGVPDLDSFLDSRRHFGPCAYVLRTTPEQRAAIRAKVEQGHHQWAGFSRWLASQDVKVIPETLARHFREGHDDES